MSCVPVTTSQSLSSARAGCGLGTTVLMRISTATIRTRFERDKAARDNDKPDHLLQRGPPWANLAAVSYPGRAPFKPGSSDHFRLLSSIVRGSWERNCMPEWVGTLVFVAAVGLSGAKISEDFGNRGLRGYAVLLITLLVYASAVAVAFA